MKPRLNDLQRECIADNYQGHLVYRALVPMALSLKQERGVPLHPAELFYASFYFLDMLIALPRAHRPNYCRYSLWVELTETLDLRPEGEDEREMAQLAVAEVMQTLVHLLAVSHVNTWLSTAQAVIDSLMEHISREEAEAIETLLWRGVSTVGEEDMRDWMSTYIQGQIGLSNDIYDLLANMQEADPQKRPAPSTIRIAPNCKSKVLVVFDAMYNAGWLVDEQGQKLTNRDKALREILRLAFAEQNDKGNLRSSIWPSKNSDNYTRNSGYFKELEAYMSKEGEAR